MWHRPDADLGPQLRMVTTPRPAGGHGLTDKVAVVTGGNTGIGRAIARTLAANGARVAIGARRAEEGRRTVELTEQDGGKAIFVPTDVRHEPQVAELVRAAVDAFGGLDLAVNSAGWQGEGHPLHRQPQEQWDEVMDTNVRGTFWSMKHQIPAILERGGGAIVNIASAAGTTGISGYSPYSASKHAVIGLTRSAALDYATQGIRVNAVNPAAVVTDMYFRLYGEGGYDPHAYRALHPMGRFAAADEIADAAVWLLSDRASFVTGQSIGIDGGYTVP
jgi:NAD(P)-dependent dehydrogenase (short-subunit alcohol dehydrogenase family)